MKQFHCYSLLFPTTHTEIMCATPTALMRGMGDGSLHPTTLVIHLPQYYWNHSTVPRQSYQPLLAHKINNSLYTNDTWLTLSSRNILGNATTLRPYLHIAHFSSWWQTWSQSLLSRIHMAPSSPSSAMLHNFSLLPHVKQTLHTFLYF